MTIHIRYSTALYPTPPGDPIRPSFRLSTDSTTVLDPSEICEFYKPFADNASGDDRLPAPLLLHIPPPLFLSAVFLGRIQSTLPLFSPPYFPRPPPLPSFSRTDHYFCSVLQPTIFLIQQLSSHPSLFPYHVSMQQLFHSTERKSNDVGGVCIAYVSPLQSGQKFASSTVCKRFSKLFSANNCLRTPPPPLSVCPYHVSCTNFLHSTEKKAELRVMMLGAWCYRPSKWAKVFLSQSIHVLA